MAVMVTMVAVRVEMGQGPFSCVPSSSSLLYCWPGVFSHSLLKAQMEVLRMFWRFLIVPSTSRSSWTMWKMLSSRGRMPPVTSGTPLAFLVAITEIHQRTFTLHNYRMVILHSLPCWTSIMWATRPNWPMIIAFSWTFYSTLCPGY